MIHTFQLAMADGLSDAMRQRKLLYLIADVATIGLAAGSVVYLWWRRGSKQLKASGSAAAAPANDDRDNARGPPDASSAAEMSLEEALDVAIREAVEATVEAPSPSAAAAAPSASVSTAPTQIAAALSFLSNAAAGAILLPNTKRWSAPFFVAASAALVVLVSPPQADRAHMARGVLLLSGLAKAAGATVVLGVLLLFAAILGDLPCAKEDWQRLGLRGLLRRLLFRPISRLRRGRSVHLRRGRSVLWLRISCS